MQRSLGDCPYDVEWCDLDDGKGCQDCNDDAINAAELDFEAWHEQGTE